MSAMQHVGVQGEKHAVVYATGKDTFFGRAAALVGEGQSQPNLQKVMSRIGGLCLATILTWCIVELAVQFGHYKHACRGGEGECPLRIHAVQDAVIWIQSAGEPAQLCQVHMAGQRGTWWCPRKGHALQLTACCPPKSLYEKESQTNIGRGLLYVDYCMCKRQAHAVARCQSLLLTAIAKPNTTLKR